MEQLIEKMKQVLATQFAFYLKVHSFHWNVTGPNFSQYHAFWGDLYNELWASLDEVAEHIRAIQGFAPGALSRMQALSNISDQVEVPSAADMFRIALADNTKMITVLTEAFRAAEDAGEVGLANFLQDRIDIHKKHGWMLRATAS